MKIPERLLQEVRTLQAEHQKRLNDIVNIAVVALDLPVGCIFNFETGDITLPDTANSTQDHLKGQSNGNRKVRQPE